MQKIVAMVREVPGAGGSMMREILSFVSDSSMKHTLAPLNGFQPDDVIPETSPSPQRRTGFVLATTDLLAKTEVLFFFVPDPGMARLRASAGIRLT